ncbi:hypothetical protein PPERSA_06991 [Pseudocohnilembus persalinus]|uniref:Uncharacterized protein n=1 Tax=Pseudocohnilembus persalinus TaxID=266149 RepID=A0A0V0QZ93_PSEPJ|nr:hypothetical protein PPERSA_06991 [Pseudocohnilembus persalinus]|eukprot:KRX07376.1 hypothetical protein PPERSA_06991 [Pseudocohnilembus persalinus]
MQQSNIQDIQSEQSCQNLTSQQQNSENESEAYTNFIGSQENSEDDEENRALDEDIENYMNKARKKFNLYKYISQPNELLRKEEETKYNINTAVQWKFEQFQ